MFLIQEVKMPPKKLSDKERRERDKLRKRKGREEEQTDEKLTRLEYQRQYAADKRQNMDEEEKAEVLKEKRKADTIRMEKMSEEERAKRLKEKREAEAIRIENMSEEERAERLKEKREADAIRIEKMSEEERADRLKQKRNSKAFRIENMEDENRKHMLKQKRDYDCEKRHSARAKVLTIDEASEKFQQSCKDLPEFVCTCCHRLLWRKSVVAFKESKYDFKCDVVKRCFAADIRKETKPGEIYVCTTCHNDLRRKKPLMPAQAVANGLRLPAVPNIPLSNDLERRLFSLACPFMKIGALPRGGQYRLQGPCINVPTNLQTVCDFLPRLPDEARVVLLKFKRKLAYKGHYMYDRIRPAVVMAWLTWLKENNPLYKDIDIRSNWCQLLEEYEKCGKWYISCIGKGTTGGANSWKRTDGAYMWTTLAGGVYMRPFCITLQEMMPM